MSEELFKAMKEEKLSFYNHKHAVLLETYEKDRKLRDFFKVTATAKDHKGKIFLASL